MVSARRALKPVLPAAIRIASVVVGVAASISIARLGGADVRGSTSALIAANALAFAAINFDLPQQVMRRGREVGSQAGAFNDLVPFWICYLALGLAGWTVLLGLGFPFPAWVALGTALFSLSTQASAVRNGLSGPTAWALTGLVQQCALGIGAALLAYLGAFSTTSGYLLVLFSYSAGFVVAVRPWNASRLRERSERGWQGWHMHRRMWAGLPWQPLRVSQLLLNRMDTLYLFSALGAAATGIYSVALSMASLASLLPAMVSQNLLFRSAQGHAYSLRRMIVQAAALTAACAIPLALGGRYALELLYGPEFDASFVPMLILLPGALFMSVVQVLANHLRMQAGAWTSSWPFVPAVATMGGLLLILPTSTVSAAAASTIGAAVAMCLLALSSLRHKGASSA